MDSWTSVEETLSVSEKGNCIHHFFKREKKSLKKERIVKSKEKKLMKKEKKCDSWKFVWTTKKDFKAKEKE